jgi:hypothetical protein
MSSDWYLKIAKAPDKMTWFIVIMLAVGGANRFCFSLIQSKPN